MLEKQDPIRENFLYPRSTDFPLDQTCFEIVRGLEKKRWKTKDINISFGIRCSDPPIQYVEQVTGEKFMLYFCRRQDKLMNGIADLAAIHKIIIPKHELLVYEGNELIYFRYAGDNWAKDQETFISTPKIDSRYIGEPKTYLRYISSWKSQCEEVLNDGLPPFLIHDDKKGKEYDLSPQDKPFYQTHEVVTEINHWLEQNVLTMLTIQDRIRIDDPSS